MEIKCERQFGFLGGPMAVCDRPFGHSGSHRAECVPFDGERNAADEERTLAVLRIKYEAQT